MTGDEAVDRLEHRLDDEIRRFDERLVRVERQGNDTLNALTALAVKLDGVLTEQGRVAKLVEGPTGPAALCRELIESVADLRMLEQSNHADVARRTTAVEDWIKVQREERKTREQEQAEMRRWKRQALLTAGLSLFGMLVTIVLFFLKMKTGG